MSKAIQLLMDEHRVIEGVLGSLETFAAQVEDGLAPDRAVLARYGDFLRGFADAFHHAKEEDILFARMVERGFSREMGPVAVMLEEHREGRAHVAGLGAVAAGTGAVTAPERQGLLVHAGGYVPLLRAHIQKEDHILYPMALRTLLPQEVDALDTEFEAFARKAESEGVADRFRALAEALQSEFRPDPSRTPALAGCWSR